MSATAGYAVLVMAMYGGAMFLMKLAGSRLDPFTCVSMNIIGYGFVGAIAMTRAQWSFGWPSLVAIAIGAMYVVGNAAFYKLSQVADVSTLAPIISLQIMIPIALGILLLSEPVTARKAFGVLLAVASIWLLSTET